MPRSKKQSIPNDSMSYETQDFVVLNTSRNVESNESNDISVDSIIKEAIESAIRNYNFNNKISSVILDSNSSALSPTIDSLDLLAENPQDNISKILQINAIVLKRINIDDIIGKTVESIYVNVNDDFKLNYSTAITGRNKKKIFENAKSLIDQFNDDVNIKHLIREHTSSTYYEGNCILCLRKDIESNSWLIDTYPLGVAILAPYTVGGEAVVLIDMNELKSRLQKAGFKYRSGKNMFFPTIEEEIQSNYPREVYEAYKNKDQYAKLDVNYTGVIRIGNLGRRYGISPIFRALPSSIILQSFYRSDEINSKARSKKILHQILRAKNSTTGTDIGIDVTGLAYAHKEIVEAYRQSGSVVYTSPNIVEKVEYVEPKSELIDIDTVAFHLNREMSTLGIGFLSMESSNQSVSTANISVEQLMKTINAITSQFERVIKKFYKRVLIDEGYDPEFAPSIKILDSEYLEFNLRKELAVTLYSIFNGSLKTSLELLGIDYNDELERRRKEEDDHVSDVFKARQTSYTSGGDTTTDNTGGRPPSDEETDKTEYDKNYNDQR